MLFLPHPSRIISGLLLQQQQHCTPIKACPQHGKPHSWTCVGLHYTTRSIKLSQQCSPFFPHPGKQDCPEVVHKNRPGEIARVYTQTRDRLPPRRPIQQKVLAFPLAPETTCLLGSFSCLLPPPLPCPSSPSSEAPSK